MQTNARKGESIARRRSPLAAALATHWQEPAVLDNPSVRDEFQGPFGASVVFRRDAAGYTGCDLFAGRLRNIAFAKTVKQLASS